jgi:hypothetical protein
MAIEGKGVLTNRDTHAAVARKIGNEWHILDASEEYPINVTKSEKVAKSYFAGIDFVNFYTLVRDYPTQAEEEELRDKWFDMIEMKYDNLPKTKFRKSKGRGHRKRPHDLAHSHHQPSTKRMKSGYGSFPRRKEGKFGIGAGKEGEELSRKLTA